MVSSPQTRTARSGKRPFLVTSVAAAVLLVGGGGVYYAATANGDGGGGGSTGASGGAGAGGTSAPSAPKQGGGPGIAPGEPDPGGSGGTVYRVRGPLPHGPSSAAVHRPEGRVTSAEVTRLARALGLAGTPRLVSGVWQLTPEKDTNGLRLDVSERAPGSWTISRHDGGPVGDTCLKGKECPPPGEAKPPAGGSPVSEAAAKAAVAPVLKAIGQDDAKLDATQIMNGSVRVVNADPVVDGLPTYGWSTGIQVGPDGSVVAGSGRLVEPAKGAAYPVIGAQQALDELNRAEKGTGAAGIGGCAIDPPAGKAQGEGDPSRADSPCPAPKPHVVTVTGAVFGLAAQDVGGEVSLVPAWLFEAREQAGAKPYTVVRTAVEPRYLTAPAQSAPPAKAERQISAYKADASGRQLSVTFWGGVCSTYTVTADETPREVTVRIAEKPTEPGKACIAIAVEITKTVTLDAPLDGRAVVDGASGQPVPRS
ncbi:hypothetical protein [Streptomyces sp. NPDC004267]|uniref:hypothetical protein n=1 Tax=Streptomyces sp. NPDC004267 TaxID=3364694 RepID=UPI0036855E91